MMLRAPGGSGWTIRPPKIELTLALMGLVAILAVVVTLFNHWEIGHETLGYWVFARVFAETGEFPITDRSPVYVLYLNGFRWLGYPTAVTVEYLVTTLIVFGGLVAVFKPYLRYKLAIFAVVLWLPFLQLAEPSVQKLALACVCWAVVMRRQQDGTKWSAASYALLGLAYLLRSSFAIFIVLFLVWDIWRALKTEGSGPRVFLKKLRPRFNHWPVLMVVVLLLVILMRQSPSPWNNIWFGSTTYFPDNGKTIDAVLIQNWNWGYILNTHQTLVGHDFYFTNDELFGGASDTLDMIRANPRFIAEQTFRWSKNFATHSARMTELPRFWSFLPFGNFYMAPLLFAAIVLGAVAAARKRIDIPMGLLILGCVFIVGSTIVTRPDPRYMVPFIPVLMLSAAWYGGYAKRFLSELHESQSRWLPWVGLAAVAAMSIIFVLHVTVELTNFGPPTGALLIPSPASVLDPLWAVTLIFVIVGYVFASTLILRAWPTGLLASDWLSKKLVPLVIPIVLLLFSNGLVYGQVLGKHAVSDVRDGDLRVMETRRVPSMKNSLSTVEPLIENCNNVLTLEHTYFGSFTDVPLDRFFDVMKIPPFGNLGDSEYGELRPDLVDCVLVSESLRSTVGAATNIKLRYDNYIKPYVEELKALGASSYKVPQFGEIVILEQPQ